MPKQRRNLRRFVFASTLSVMLAFTATVVLCIVYLHDIARWRYMSMICSDDPETRMRGMQYLYVHKNDPVVVERASSMLEGADDACFDALVDALSHAGLWGPRFERAWARYLSTLSTVEDPLKRTNLAVELARLLWMRGPYADDARLAATVETLVGDAEPKVRLNALSAAASLSGDRRLALLRRLAADPEPEIARHAWIMLYLLGQAQGVDRPASIPAAAFEPPPVDPPEGASDAVKLLSALEAMPTGSAVLAIEGEMPDLIRIESVRVSTTSKPGDLMAAFNSESPEVRDLAALAAAARFSPAERARLATDLILRFTDAQRMAGAIVAGMVEPDARTEKLMKLVHMRAQPDEGWIVAQHYRLGLAMMGQPPAGFDPQTTLAHTALPKTTMILGLLHSGDLAGLDWLLNPLGEPPVDLQLALDALRFVHVIRRYLPDAPRIDLNADLETQRFQIDMLRDWYLLFRPTLSFDPERRVFRRGKG